MIDLALYSRSGFISYFRANDKCLKFVSVITAQHIVSSMSFYFCTITQKRAFSRKENLGLQEAKRKIKWGGTARGRSVMWPTDASLLAS